MCSPEELLGYMYISSSPLSSFSYVSLRWLYLSLSDSTVVAVCSPSLPFRCQETLHHADVLRHEMALSHLPLFHPWDCSLNCDVALHLILFPSLEPLAGGAEELAAEIEPRDAADTKPAQCLWVCVIVRASTMMRMSMSLKVCVCQWIVCAPCHPPTTNFTSEVYSHTPTRACYPKLKFASRMRQISVCVYVYLHPGRLLAHM